MFLQYFEKQSAADLITEVMHYMVSKTERNVEIWSFPVIVKSLRTV